MRTALLIYNPAAGRFPSWMLAERAARILAAHGWQIQVEQTEDGEHITALAAQAVEQGMDALFIGGGDGSLNRALPALIGSETALGVLPAGTANVWAQEIGLHGLGWTRWSALEESARLLVEAPVRSVDVGMCNQAPFLLWAGIGLDGFVVRRIEPRSPIEKNFAVMHYFASAVWNAARWEGMNLRVLSGNEEINGRYLLAVISNTHLYAGGLAEISPEALLDDGKFELWLFEGSSMADTVQRAWDLLAGRHIQSDQVHCFSSGKIRLESDAPMYIQVDGEPLEPQSPVEVEVRQRALRVLVPAKAPRTLFATHQENPQ